MVISGEILNEVRLFTTSVALGAALTFVYDGWLIFRNVFKHNLFWISVEDLLFWIIAAVAVFMSLHEQNNGVLRWFIVIGAGIGMILYKYSVSGFYVKYISKVALYIVVYIKKIAYFVGKPLIWLKKRVNSGFLGTKSGIKKVTIMLKNWLTVCIKWFTIALCKHNGQNGDLHNDEET
ncbi:MAG: spore cortex biosynthesis protein YabQ [Lachnospiraceae bacterium]|nr:spore cortex biosynthesis protein YabQ [Lachnospiraceae bacterium]